MQKCKIIFQISEIVIYCVFLTVVIYLLVTAQNVEDNTWDYVWFTFANIILIVIPTVGIFSARHINRNSRSVERLGIRTNSSIMNVYLAFWTSVAIICIAIGVLVTLLYEDHKFKEITVTVDQDIRKLRMLMTISILIAFR